MSAHDSGLHTSSLYGVVRSMETKSLFLYLVLQAHGDEVEEFVHAGFVQAHDGGMCKLSIKET